MKKILVIDDDENLTKLLCDVLRMDSYTTLTAHDGVEGLEVLDNNPDIDLILLDWIMPQMNGIEFLKRMKEKYQSLVIPVIMVTGQSETKDIIQGIESGVYYYLTKPFDINVLKVIVGKVISDFENLRKLKSETSANCGKFLNIMKEGTFEVRTSGEAVSLVSFLKNGLGNEKYCIGLLELLYNGIEHGNLGIGYEQKENLLDDDSFDQEIEKRLGLPEYKDKYVTIKYARTGVETILTIEDMGKGFSYEDYLSINEDRVFDLHGRGIAMASMIFTTGMTYLEGGRKVRVCIPRE